jgi:DNA repair exonuclease SbcCD nuclease subunit
VFIFPGDDVTSAPVERGGDRLATVHGISYPRRDVTENLALRYARGPEAGLHIGLLHCNVGARPGHALYSPCTVEDLRRAGLHYWALGHVHRLEVVSNVESLVVYPGNLQGRSAHAGEQGRKGAVVLEADADGIREFDFVALDRIRFLDLPVDAVSLPDLPALHAALSASAERLREAHGERALILRPVLTGRTALHADLQVNGAREDLVKELRREAEAREPFLWWELPRDSTSPPLNRQAIADRGDLSSALLERVDALRRSEKAVAPLLESQADVLRRLGATRWLARDLPANAGTALLRDAEDMALSALEKDR